MKRTDGWAFIVNPIAGVGYGATCATTVEQMMQRHGVRGEIALTRGKGHATELAAEFADRGFGAVVGVGGDGTLSEIAQALTNRKGVTFGAVAAGTGNDFIHILGFPNRFADEHWTALFEGAEIDMDAGRCNDRFFINGMGLGFDARVAAENYHIEAGGEAKRGKGSNYLWMIVKTIFKYHEEHVRATVGGRVEERYCFLNTIANGRRLAGGLTLTPRAVANDGLLDFLWTDPLTIPARFKELVAVMRKTHLSDPVMHYLQTDKAIYEFDDKVPAHLDGELIFQQRFEISTHPAALRMIYNPRGDHYFADRKTGAPVA